MCGLTVSIDWASFGKLADYSSFIILLSCPERLWDRRIVPENEYYDSDEGETDGAATKPVRNEQAYRPSASDLVESLNGGLVSAVPQAPPGLMSVVLEKRKAAELDRDEEEEEEMEELLRDDERKRILLATGIEASETGAGVGGNGNGSGRVQVESEREEGAGPQGTGKYLNRNFLCYEGYSYVIQPMSLLSSFLQRMLPLSCSQRTRL